MFVRGDSGKAAAVGTEGTEGGLVCSREAGPMKGSSSTCTSRWRVPADWCSKKTTAIHLCSLMRDGGLEDCPRQHHGERPAPLPVGAQLGSGPGLGGGGIGGEK